MDNLLDSLNVNEIFNSISGEVSITHQGMPATFIRLAGCNLNCKWCDTRISQKEENGFVLSFNDIIERISQYKNEVIIITGGEPLLQQEKLKKFCDILNTKGYNIIIETNGTIIPDIKDVHYCIDYKVQYPDKMISFYNFCEYADLIKIVVSDRREFEDALRIFNIIDLYCTKHQKVSPNYAISTSRPERISNFVLAKWLLKQKQGMRIILNVQIHKLINMK